MHRNLRTTLEVCAAAAGLAFLADAQKVAEGGIATIQGTHDKGPWSEPKSDFDAILRSPNATGQFDVPGFDIPTDSNITGGWSWSISVVADIPIPSQWDESDEFYTGGKLSFHVPFSPENSSSDGLDDGWSVCLYEWVLWGAKYPNSLRADDGTCSSVLSSECIAAIEQAAASKHTPTRCQCPFIKDIPECAALGDEIGPWISGSCAAMPRNISAIRAWGADGLEMSSFGDASGHERGNTTAYNYIGSIAWPVMASFNNFRTGDPVTAKLSCPRADTPTEGSVAPTADGLDDAGDGQGQGSDDGQSDQQDGGGRINANWLVLGSLLAVAMLF